MGHPEPAPVPNNSIGKVYERKVEGVRGHEEILKRVQDDDLGFGLYCISL